MPSDIDTTKRTQRRKGRISDSNKENTDDGITKSKELGPPTPESSIDLPDPNDVTSPTELLQQSIQLLEEVKSIEPIEVSELVKYIETADAEARSYIKYLEDQLSELKSSPKSIDNQESDHLRKQLDLRTEELQNTKNVLARVKQELKLTTNELNNVKQELQTATNLLNDAKDETIVTKNLLETTNEANASTKDLLLKCQTELESTKVESQARLQKIQLLETQIADKDQNVEEFKEKVMNLQFDILENQKLITSMKSTATKSEQQSIIEAFSDLTNVIIRSAVIDSDSNTATFDCLQTSSKGDTIHYFLTIPHNSTDSYKSQLVLYKPQLDPVRDATVIEKLPDYLTATIEFSRDSLHKFFMNIVDGLER
ncbi:hypothetical protein CANCADRAFT_2774 [Tortispora caseinolytica NRRL Y-17796]|uniref:Monopolin complex subunit Csm1/Pcs1 C-terminal domain-containing protein n=1 Tax=Tortispora caseinolytica NRRL Y-17796 TaxID=767744 RepID=A0A1E4TH75_9ASCO|nr:hypothetical protein CANCADRAFT_2774 [Tortispora caseinolytica NRRL Y-17796]